MTDVRRVLTPELCGRRRRRRPVSSCSSISDAARTGWADRRWRRSTASSARRRPTSTIPALLKGFFAAIQELSAAGVLAAYHDRSDGGLFVTLAEMAFAGGVGLDVEIGGLGDDPLAGLFAEELGAVVAVRAGDVARVREVLGRHGLGDTVRGLGRVQRGDRVILRRDGRTVFEERRSILRGIWSETTHAMQSMRDDLTCADEEQAARVDSEDPGLSALTTFDIDEDVGRAGRAPAAAHARASRSCASRASTGRSRWRRPSIAPASRRSTST